MSSSSMMTGRSSLMRGRLCVGPCRVFLWYLRKPGGVHYDSRRASCTALGSKSYEGRLPFLAIASHFWYFLDPWSALCEPQPMTN